MSAPVDATAAQARQWLQAPGYGLGASQFTFSVPGAGAVWNGYGGGGEPANAAYAPPSVALATAFRAAVALWDEYIAPDFAEVAENGASVGELRIAFTDVGDAYSYAYEGPTATPGGRVGDVWVGAGARDDSFANGSYGFMAVVHEVGHALGLKHPFEAPAAPAALDNYRYTVMSYTGIGTIVRFAASGSGVLATSTGVVARTPMVLDIAAVQASYGAEPTTRAGDTVYSFSQRDGAVQTMYDAGGTDRIDASNFTDAVAIDLRPGAYSSLGIETLADQIAYWTALFPGSAGFIRDVLGGTADLFTYRDNVGIAFGTVIEDATGGAGNDTLFGNDVGNVLRGGAGDDTLNGAGGNDTLDGGTGNDTFLVQDAGDVVVEGADGGSADIVYAAVSYAMGADVRVENFAAATAISTAGLALTGNQYGQAIAGTYGNDTILGGGSSVNGGDILIGLRGDDSYLVDAPNILVIEAAGEGNDIVTVLAGGSGFVLNGESFVETLSAAAGTAAIAITGNPLAQAIVGNDGANVLSSGGGAGDTLAGGAGDDTYRVYGQQDVVREVAGQGNDVVFAGASYQLRDGAAVEGLSAANQLSTDPAAGYTLRGNAFGQTLVGNDVANVLDGRGGSDTLIGRGGADTFAFTTAPGAGNVAAIADFLSGTDRIGLASDVFAVAGVTTANFVLGTAAADGDDRILYDRASGALFYDADGNGAGAAVPFANLGAGTVLAASDFAVIAPVASLAAG